MAEYEKEIKELEKEIALMDIEGEFVRTMNNLRFVASSLCLASGKVEFNEDDLAGASNIIYNAINVIEERDRLHGEGRVKCGALS